MPYKSADRHRTYNAAQMRERRAKEAIDRNEIASYIADLETLIPPDDRPPRPELEVIKWAWSAEPAEAEKLLNDARAQCGGSRGVSVSA